MASYRITLALLMLSMVSAVDAGAAQCGSSLLLEVVAPTAFEGVDSAAGSAVRFWEAGVAGSNRSDAGCLAGCTLTSGPPCTGGGDCIALTGVNWLNASCAAPGHIPTRTVFLLEQTTSGSGGRWAAINVDRNPDDANVDLDSKAAAICSGCSSTLSPYLGGTGRPTVSGSSSANGVLTVSLTWSPPSPAAQALSNGNNVVTSYGIYYRTNSGTLPPASGDPTGWIRASDTEADGLSLNGHSTDTSATVEVPLFGLEQNIAFSVGLSFDGTGDPQSDSNTLPSAYLSDQSDPLVVPTSCGEPNDLLLQNETVNDVREFVACLTITAESGFVVGTTGEVIFRAGQSISLQNGFSVSSGGSFAAVIDSSLSN